MDIVYDYRMLYNALWLNTRPESSHKSRKHNDGTLCCGGGWFVVSTKLNGNLLSNHYKDTPENWELFKIPSYDSELYVFDPKDTPEEQLKNALYCTRTFSSRTHIKICKLVHNINYEPEERGGCALADVIIFDDGQCIVKWTGMVRSLVVHKSLDDFQQISMSGKRLVGDIP